MSTPASSQIVVPTISGGIGSLLGCWPSRSLSPMTTDGRLKFSPIFIEHARETRSWRDDGILLRSPVANDHREAQHTFGLDEGTVFSIK